VIFEQLVWKNFVAMISPPILNHVLIKFIFRGFPENCLISRVFGQYKKWGGEKWIFTGQVIFALIATVFIRWGCNFTGNTTVDITFLLIS
jgi:hypothetical protein